MWFLMIGCGAAAGWLCMLLSKKLITARTDEKVEKWYLTNKLSPVFWCLTGSAGFGVIQAFGNEPVQKVQLITIFLICCCISAVDFSIRKIPNSLLLALIAVKVIFLIVDFSKEKLFESFWGFGIASVIFAIPSFFKISVGAGDIKLAAITGFYLGTYGFLQAMIIMAISIALYGIYIMIRKIGNFKTKTAMGPYLAFGLICTLLYPIL